MNNIDLGNSFNKLKKQIFMNNETEKSFTDMFNETYNIGIDRCINFCESQKAIYQAISANGNEWRVIESIIKSLEYFKKPVPAQTKTENV